ncbi:type IV pilus assembly protein PilC [Winogradskyella wandonensis]|uniref:Type IV pilus assembly protein PilC n=1 Tax=Winogradskyella wandonensis TaxID=1442586 RepID=A0A4R1KKL2_9FLAO|nr:type II secretion system F family protein [Winogradskyella wandonensis]TCK65007.1 type IV pilus assembly protein PilC [Winogradskyella wandonensis]
MGFKLENTKTATLKKTKISNKESFLKKEITFLGSSFSNKTKEDFYTELGLLLKAGITLKDALELIENAQKKRQQKVILKAISNDIVTGASLSDSLQSKKEFTEYEYYSIKIGEETGTLQQVTEQLGAFYSRKNEQRRNIISALTYPIIILSTAILVVAFMLSYVVPMFQDIFKQQGVDLPKITEFIIAASEFFKTYGWLFLVIIIIFIASKSVLKKKLWYRRLTDKLTLKLPYIGSFLKTIYLSQFTQAVSLLTASKVPLVNSIQLVKKMIGFMPLQDALEVVEADILKGKSLSQSLDKHKLFDAKMVALVKVAEETNQNEFIFQRLNARYTTQVQQKSKLLSTALEPFIIMIVGVLVGVILIAMYLPMFRLSSVLG